MKKIIPISLEGAGSSLSLALHSVLLTGRPTPPATYEVPGWERFPEEKIVPTLKRWGLALLEVTVENFRHTIVDNVATFLQAFPEHPIKNIPTPREGATLEALRNYHVAVLNSVTSEEQNIYFISSATNYKLAASLEYEGRIENDVTKYLRESPENRALLQKTMTLLDKILHEHPDDFPRIHLEFITEFYAGRFLRQPFSSSHAACGRELIPTAERAMKNLLRNFTSSDTATVLDVVIDTLKLRVLNDVIESHSDVHKETEKSWFKRYIRGYCMSHCSVSIPPNDADLSTYVNGGATDHMVAQGEKVAWIFQTKLAEMFVKEVSAFLDFVQKELLLFDAPSPEYDRFRKDIALVDKVNGLVSHDPIMKLAEDVSEKRVEAYLIERGYCEASVTTGKTVQAMIDQGFVSPEKLLLHFQDIYPDLSATERLSAFILLEHYTSPPILFHQTMIGHIATFIDHQQYNVAFTLANYLSQFSQKHPLPNVLYTLHDVLNDFSWLHWSDLDVLTHRTPCRPEVFDAMVHRFPTHLNTMTFQQHPFECFSHFELSAEQAFYVLETYVDSQQFHDLPQRINHTLLSKPLQDALASKLMLQVKDICRFAEQKNYDQARRAMCYISINMPAAPLQELAKSLTDFSWLEWRELRLLSSYKECNPAVIECLAAKFPAEIANLTYDTHPFEIFGQLPLTDEQAFRVIESFLESPRFAKRPRCLAEYPLSPSLENALARKVRLQTDDIARHVSGGDYEKAYKLFATLQHNKQPDTYAHLVRSLTDFTWLSFEELCILSTQGAPHPAIAECMIAKFPIALERTQFNEHPLNVFSSFTLSEDQAKRIVDIYTASRLSDRSKYADIPLSLPRFLQDVMSAKVMPTIKKYVTKHNYQAAHKLASTTFHTQNAALWEDLLSLHDYSWVDLGIFKKLSQIPHISLHPSLVELSLRLYEQELSKNVPMDSFNPLQMYQYASLSPAQAKRVLELNTQWCARHPCIPYDNNFFTLTISLLKTSALPFSEAVTYLLPFKPSDKDWASAEYLSHSESVTEYFVSMLPEARAVDFMSLFGQLIPVGVLSPLKEAHNNAPHAEIAKVIRFSHYVNTWAMQSPSYRSSAVKNLLDGMDDAAFAELAPLYLKKFPADSENASYFRRLYACDKSPDHSDFFALVSEVQNTLSASFRVDSFPSIFTSFSAECIPFLVVQNLSHGSFSHFIKYLENHRCSLLETNFLSLLPKDFTKIPRIVSREIVKATIEAIEVADQLSLTESDVDATRESILEHQLTALRMVFELNRSVYSLPLLSISHGGSRVELSSYHSDKAVSDAFQMLLKKAGKLSPEMQNLFKAFFTDVLRQTIVPVTYSVEELQAALKNLKKIKSEHRSLFKGIAVSEVFRRGIV